MSDLVAPSTLRAALRTLRGYLEDLRRADFEQAATKLRLVVNYCQKDDLTRRLAERLRARVSTEALLERTAGTSLREPVDPVDRLAFHYTLLFHIKQGHRFDLRELLSRGTFAGGGIEGRWQDFQRRVTDRLLEGVDAVARALEELHGDDAAVDPDAALA